MELNTISGLAIAGVICSVVLSMGVPIALFIAGRVKLKARIDHKQGIPIFIVNIIAVKPGEHPLLEKHLHCVSSLHLPAQYLLPASYLLALCLL